MSAGPGRGLSKSWDGQHDGLLLGFFPCENRTVWYNERQDKYAALMRRERLVKVENYNGQRKDRL